jgi:hypothetical protein
MIIDPEESGQEDLETIQRLFKTTLKAIYSSDRKISISKNQPLHCRWLRVIERFDIRKKIESLGEHVFFGGCLCVS